ncbi:MAG: MFS transporter, partial [Gammaproteobacteria bacterium]
MAKPTGLPRLIAPYCHYGWAIAALTFFVLLSAAGARSAASILIVPLEQAFGWNTAIVSGAIAVNLTLYGALGPLIAAALERIGVTRMITRALLLIASGIACTFLMNQAWHFVVLWGVLVGIGFGIISPVLAATIANRWFDKKNGLAMGLLTASTATGQMIFLPALSSLEANHGWQAVTGSIGVVSLLLIPLVRLIMRERPSEIGLNRYGAADYEVPARFADERMDPLKLTSQALGRGIVTRDFWILFGSFAVCGLSTHGLIGTHFITACIDYHIEAPKAARMMAAMAVFDLFGTILSGWMSDRWDNRYLLFWYYGFRG